MSDEAWREDLHEGQAGQEGVSSCLHELAKDLDRKGQGLRVIRVNGRKGGPGSWKHWFGEGSRVEHVRSFGC